MKKLLVWIIVLAVLVLNANSCIAAEISGIVDEKLTDVEAAFKSINDAKPEERAAQWIKVDDSIKQEVWKKINSEVQLSIWNSGDAAGKSDILGVMNKGEIAKKEEFLTTVVKNYNSNLGQDFKIVFPKKSENQPKEIKYEEGANGKVISIKGPDDKKYEIPLENIPVNVKEIKFAKIIESSDYAVVYTDKSDNTALLSQGVVQNSGGGESKWRVLENGKEVIKEINFGSDNKATFLRGRPLSAKDSSGKEHNFASGNYIWGSSEGKAFYLDSNGMKISPNYRDIKADPADPASYCGYKVNAGGSESSFLGRGTFEKDSLTTRVASQNNIILSYEGANADIDALRNAYAGGKAPAASNFKTIEIKKSGGDAEVIVRNSGIASVDISNSNGKITVSGSGVSGTTGVTGSGTAAVKISQKQGRQQTEVDRNGAVGNYQSGEINVGRDFSSNRGNVGDGSASGRSSSAEKIPGAQPRETYQIEVGGISIKVSSKPNNVIGETVKGTDGRSYTYTSECGPGGCSRKWVMVN